MAQDLDKKSFFSQWLEKLQQESWQLELIISGFALFGVYSAKSVLVDIELWKASNQIPDLLKFFSTLPETGWKIFFINLLVHVILRALWIGSIGLRYVSSEINYDQLNYSTFFTDYLRRKVGDYDDFIEKLEKICSVLFSYTFLLFLMALSFSCIVAFTLLPFSFVDRNAINKDITYTMLLGWWAISFWGFGLIVFFDFATGGRLKKIKDITFSKIYFYLYQFYSIVSLSIFYRPLLYNFLDNKYTRRLFYFSFIYIFIIHSSHVFFNTSSSRYNPIGHEYLMDGEMIGPAWYQDSYEDRLFMLSTDERKKYLLENRSAVRLSSYYIDGHVKLFLRIDDQRADRIISSEGLAEQAYPDGLSFFWQDSKLTPDYVLQKIDSFDQSLKQINEKRSGLRKQIRQSIDDELNQANLERELDVQGEMRSNLLKEKDDWLKLQDEIRTQKIKDVYQSLFDVSIDGQSIQERLQCTFFDDPVTYDRGLMCYISTDSLPAGLHRLEINKKTDVESGTGKIMRRTYVLPFVRTD
jgi:hypothetical protein